MKQVLAHTVKEMKQVPAHIVEEMKQVPAHTVKEIDCCRRSLINSGGAEYFGLGCDPPIGVEH